MATLVAVGHDPASNCSSKCTSPRVITLTLQAKSSVVETSSMFAVPKLGQPLKPEDAVSSSDKAIITTTAAAVMSSSSSLSLHSGASVETSASPAIRNMDMDFVIDQLATNGPIDLTVHHNHRFEGPAMSAERKLFLEAAAKVAGWNADDVFNFISGLGFADQAAFVFREQEIDGVALLSMSRDDVLSRQLPIKLGPAVKLYQKIRALQLAHSQCQEPFQIFVRLPQKLITINDVKSSDTIENVKAKIQDKEGIPSKALSVKFQSKYLSDHSTLASCNIHAAATLELLVPLRGGRPHLFGYFSTTCYLSWMSVAYAFTFLAQFGVMLGFWAQVGQIDIAGSLTFNLFHTAIELALSIWLWCQYRVNKFRDYCAVGLNRAFLGLIVTAIVADAIPFAIAMVRKAPKYVPLDGSYEEYLEDLERYNLAWNASWSIFCLLVFRVFFLIGASITEHTRRNDVVNNRRGAPPIGAGDGANG